MFKKQQQPQLPQMRPKSAAAGSGTSGQRTASPYTPPTKFPPPFNLNLNAALPSIPMTPPPGYHHRGMAVSPSNISMRAKGKLLPKKILMGARDKEALLEEIIELKRVLYEQDRHIKYHKVHTHTLEIENKYHPQSLFTDQWNVTDPRLMIGLCRKLEKDIEDLESQGAIEAPRTGGSSRLRAKLQGLKMRINELQSTSIAQQEELSVLRKDMRVSHTKEVELERDVFAGEVGNLQRLVRKLSASHNRITCQNKELGRLKDKGAMLEANHERLEMAMNAAQEILGRGSQELKNYKNKAREATLEANRNMKKFKELHQHSQFLEELLNKEKTEKDFLEKRVFDLAQELRRVDNQLQHIKGYNRLDAFKGLSASKKPEDVETVKSGSGETTPSKSKPPHGTGTPCPQSPAPPTVPSSGKSSPQSPKKSKGLGCFGVRKDSPKQKRDSEPSKPQPQPINGGHMEEPKPTALKVVHKEDPKHTKVPLKHKGE